MNFTEWSIFDLSPAERLQLVEDLEGGMTDMAGKLANNRRSNRFRRC